MCEKSLHIDVDGTDKSNWGAKSNLHHLKMLHVLHRRASTTLVSFSTMIALLPPCTFIGWIRSIKLAVGVMSMSTIHPPQATSVPSVGVVSREGERKVEIAASISREIWVDYHQGWIDI